MFQELYAYGILTLYYAVPVTVVLLLCGYPIALGTLALSLCIGGALGLSLVFTSNRILRKMVASGRVKFDADDIAYITSADGHNIRLNVTRSQIMNAA